MGEVGLFAKTNRRTFLARVGAAVGATAATTTSGGCALSASGIGKKTLQILGQTSEIDEATIAAFEADHPDVNVSLTQYSWDLALTMLAAGTPPDLMRGAGATDTAFLASRDLALPLDDFLADSQVLHENDLDPINDLWRYDGAVQGNGPLHGLVKDYSSDLTVWANTGSLPDEMAAAVSRTEPMSYRELRASAKAATEVQRGRTTTIGFGCVFGNKPDFPWLQAMMAQADVNVFSDDMKTVDLSSDAAIEAMTFFADLVKSKATASFLAPQATTDVDLYVADRIAFLLSGYWTTGLIAGGPEDLQRESVLLPAPQLGDTRISPCLAGTGMWIPKQAQYPELAWEFMEFYFGGKPAQDRAASGWGVPSLKSLHREIPEDTPLQRQAWQVQQEEQRFFQILPFTPYAQADTVSAALLSAFSEGIRQGVSVRQICQDCAAAINQVMARGRS